MLFAWDVFCPKRTIVDQSTRHCRRKFSSPLCPVHGVQSCSVQYYSRRSFILQCKTCLFLWRIQGRLSPDPPPHQLKCENRMAAETELSTLNPPDPFAESTSFFKFINAKDPRVKSTSVSRSGFLQLMKSANVDVCVLLKPACLCVP